MTKELQNAFQPFWTGDRYQDELETVYITGFEVARTLGVTEETFLVQNPARPVAG